MLIVNGRGEVRGVDKCGIGGRKRGGGAAMEKAGEDEEGEVDKSDHGRGWTERSERE